MRVTSLDLHRGGTHRRVKGELLALTVVACLVSPLALAASPAQPPPSKQQELVCCKKGRHYFKTTHRGCEFERGYVPATRLSCHSDHVRVCCAKGERIWWTTWHACRRADGDGIADTRCRRN